MMQVSAAGEAEMLDVLDDEPLPQGHQSTISRKTHSVICSWRDFSAGNQLWAASIQAPIEGDEPLPQGRQSTVSRKTH